jgi:signal transduction histidine kinase
MRIFAAALPLVYRPPGQPTGVALAVLGAAVVLVFANTAALIIVAAGGGRVRAGSVFAVDLTAAFAVDLLAFVAAPLGAGPFWYYLAATAAIWTVLLGTGAGVVTAAAWFALYTGWAVLAGPPAGLGSPLHVLVLLGTAVAAASAAGSAAGAVCDPGWRTAVRLGRELERRETRRWLHDGPVQTLEAIALLAGRPRPDVLPQIESAARDGALALRRRLAHDGDPEQPLAALEHVVTAARVRGLRISVTPRDVPARLPAERVAALRGATAEALRNVAKHAGTNEAEVVAVGTADRVEVTVHDGGRGFEPDRTTLGFGLGESIAGRLAEVGGGCAVYSRPGAGTRLVMWVPR